MPSRALGTYREETPDKSRCHPLDMMMFEKGTLKGTSPLLSVTACGFESVSPRVLAIVNMQK